MLICAAYNQLHAFSQWYDDDANMDNMTQAKKDTKAFVEEDEKETQIKKTKQAVFSQLWMFLHVLW